MSVYDTFLFLLSSTPVYKHISGTRVFPLSVRPSVSLTCIQHWCITKLYSLINARFNEHRTDANLQAFVAISGDILSSHDKNQKLVHNHACVHWLWTCLWSFSHSDQYSRNVNPYTKTTKTHHFPNEENTHAFLMKRTHTQVCLLRNAYASFLFFLNHCIRAWWNHVGWCLPQMWSAKAQGSLGFCAISSVSRCPLAQSFEVDKD